MFKSFSSQELHHRILKLTIALYRVTDYFPKAEILRNHLREKANEIFEAIMELSCDADREHDLELLVQKIRTTKGYLIIARTLNYVRPLNFIVLEKEYGLIEDFLESERIKFLNQPVHEDIRSLEQGLTLTALKKSYAANSVSEDTAVNDHASREDGEGETQKGSLEFYDKIPRSLNDRQKIIVNRLRISKHAKISDFYAAFEGISSKTIQRDLQNLVDQHILSKQGEKRWTVYSLTENNAQFLSVL